MNITTNTNEEILGSRERPVEFLTDDEEDSAVSELYPNELRKSHAKRAKRLHTMLDVFDGTLNNMNLSSDSHSFSTSPSSVADILDSPIVLVPRHVQGSSTATSCAQLIVEKPANSSIELPIHKPNSARGRKVTTRKYKKRSVKANTTKTIDNANNSADTINPSTTAPIAAPSLTVLTCSPSVNAADPFITANTSNATITTNIDTISKYLCQLTNCTDEELHTRTNNASAFRAVLQSQTRVLNIIKIMLSWDQKGKEGNV